jgi:carbamoyltransferase
MNYIGISNGFHDAGITVLDNIGNILFAGHSERYSKQKHDKELSPLLLTDALSYLTNKEYELHYYERPWLTSLRQLRAGQPVDFRTIKNRIGKKIVNQFNTKKITTHAHHLSHAAAGFQTSPYEKATVVIIDAIGEFDTITIWNAYYDMFGVAQYDKLWSMQYPDSIGLFYSAMTERVGLRPLDEEYILMGMSAYGDPNRLHSDIMHDFVYIPTWDMGGLVQFRENLHKGCKDWRSDLSSEQDMFDIAAGTQSVYETLLNRIFQYARRLVPSEKLVFMGGCALICVDEILHTCVESMMYYWQEVKNELNKL